jgi:hypothetical protein
MTAAVWDDMCVGDVSTEGGRGEGGDHNEEHRADDVWIVEQSSEETSQRGELFILGFGNSICGSFLWSIEASSV